MPTSAKEIGAYFNPPSVEQELLPDLLNPLIQATFEGLRIALTAKDFSQARELRERSSLMIRAWWGMRLDRFDQTHHQAPTESISGWLKASTGEEFYQKPTREGGIGADLVFTLARRVPLERAELVYATDLQERVMDSVLLHQKLKRGIVKRKMVTLI